MAETVLGYLSKQGPTRVPDLAAALDRSPVEADRCCFSVQEEQYVRSLGWGEYEISDRGGHYLGQAAATED